MNHEALIHLDLESDRDNVLVSSPEFPLLHLSIGSMTSREIERHVLPVLKEMVEYKAGGPVELRLVEEVTDSVLQPHVIAKRIDNHVE